MKTLNKYFFGEEYVHISDEIWFYGGLTLFVVIGLVVIL